MRCDSSPYAIAQDGLSGLIDAAVQTRRLEAMHAAMRVDVINLAVDYAIRSADAFTAPSLSPARRRELARRAVVAELATALRLPERTMTRLVSEAWTLATELPATLAALRSGSIDEAHARVIVDETAGLTEAPVRERLDAELAVRATTTTAASLRRIARRLRESAQAESLAERHERARAQRRVELEPARDGMAWLHLHLAAGDALLIRDRLDRVAAEVRDDEVRDDESGASGIDAPHARPAPSGCRARPAPARRPADRRGVPRRGGNRPAHRARDRAGADAARPTTTHPASSRATVRSTPRPHDTSPRRRRRSRGSSPIRSRAPCSMSTARPTARRPTSRVGCGCATRPAGSPAATAVPPAASSITPRIGAITVTPRSTISRTSARITIT